METTTETNQANRELTSTEIKITLAQIEDRLVRAISAAQEFHEFQTPEITEYENEDEATPEQIKNQQEKDTKASDDAESKIRQKFNIPYGVCLFPQESANESDIPLFMKMAKWWVKGEMDDESFELFTFHFCEIVEVDYFWILMDQPGFFYAHRWKDRNGEPTYAELESELKQIGTRSKKKKRIDFKLNIGHW